MFVESKDQYISTQMIPQPNNQRREIGNEAVWTLSSAKPGNGVDQLRDDNINTFWQSDGNQPHYEIAIYLDFKSDESYTPNKISIRAGTNINDLKEAFYVELKEPSGWYIFPLKTKLLDGTEKQSIFCHQKRLYSYDEYINMHPVKSAQWKGHSSQANKNIRSQRGLGFPDFKSPEITQYYSLR